MHLDQIIPRAIQVGRIQYLSMPYRSANAGGPNHCSVPYRVAGSDTYPCHTGRPMHLAQIISPCHTGWPDPIPIRAIQVGQCSCPKSFLRAIQVGPIFFFSLPTCWPMHLALIISPWNTGWPDTILSASYRLAGSDTYPCHTGQPTKLAQIISLCHTCRPIQFPPIISPMSYQLPECTT